MLPCASRSRGTTRAEQASHRKAADCAVLRYETAGAVWPRSPIPATTHHRSLVTHHRGNDWALPPAPLEFGKRDRRAKDSRTNQALRTSASLESFLYLSVPEAAFDGRKRCVVVVLQGSSHKGWIGIEHVLHPKGDRYVIPPSTPFT